jgi:hypothetical protein
LPEGFFSLEDIVYDCDLIDGILNAISAISALSQKTKPFCLISSTIRNPETYSTFLTKLGKPVRVGLEEMGCSNFVCFA